MCHCNILKCLEPQVPPLALKRSVGMTNHRELVNAGLKASSTRAAGAYVSCKSALSAFARETNRRTLAGTSSRTESKRLTAANRVKIN